MAPAQEIEDWFSNHALLRARQRSVRMTDLSLVLAERDREVPVGAGCTALAISRGRWRELVAEGYPLSMVDRAVKITVVQSADGEIVTVLRPTGHRGRRYRRPFQTVRNVNPTRISRAA